MVKKLVKRYFSNFAYFYRYLRYRVFIALFMSVAVGVMDGFGLAMFLPLLQMVKENGEGKPDSLGKLQFLVDGINKMGFELTLVSVLVFMFIFFLLKGFAKFWSLNYRYILQQYFIRMLRNSMLNNFNKISFRYFVGADVGKIQNTMSGEVDRVARAYSMYFATFEQSVLVVVYIGFAFVVDLKFATLVTVGGVLTNVFYNFIYKLTIGASRKLTNDSNLYQGQIIQHVSTFKYIKATGLVALFTEKMKKTISTIEVTRRQIGYYSAILQSAREPMLVAIVSIVIIIQVNILGGGLGTILISLLFFYRALMALTNMQTNWNRFLEVAGSLENLQEFQTELLNAGEKGGNLPFKRFNNVIEAKNVTVYYEEKCVLNDISFTIKKNEVIAFVGESGSGKTTLMNVIIGLMRINSGEMLIDGINQNELDIVSFQRKIGYITQEPVIFNDTIYNNIALWAEPTSENMERFLSTLRKTSLVDLIDELPQGYDTLIGSNGISLSGGQKQRISIARELYKDIDILVMDEATSSLDSETEKSIQASIDALKGSYTILVVAHRLSTVKNADRIAVLKNGELIAINSFNGLLQNNEAFKSMVQLQEIKSN